MNNISKITISAIGGFISGIILQALHKIIELYSEVTFFVEAKDLELSISKPGGYLWITLFCMIFVFAVFNFFFFIPPRIKKDKIFIISCGIYVSILVLIGLFYFTIPAHVESSEVIKGKSIGEGFNYCLLVKPATSNTCWVQKDISPDQQGYWESQAFFGGYGRFEIILLAIKESFKFQCREGVTISGKEINKYKNRITRRVIRATRKELIMKKYISIFMLVFLLAGIVLYGCSSGKQKNTNIEITSLSEGANIKMTEIVNGTVSEPELNVYVLIHPLTTNLWWVQNIPAVGPDGKWQTLCYFGTENEGIGDHYEIMAIASSKRNLYKPGDTLEVLPQNVLRSSSVTVHREE